MGPGLTNTTVTARAEPGVGGRERVRRLHLASKPTPQNGKRIPCLAAGAAAMRSPYCSVLAEVGEWHRPPSPRSWDVLGREFGEQGSGSPLRCQSIGIPALPRAAPRGVCRLPHPDPQLTTRFRNYFMCPDNKHRNTHKAACLCSTQSCHPGPHKGRVPHLLFLLIIVAPALLPALRQVLPLAAAPLLFDSSCGTF